jgi:Uma2 family endonuclease
VGGRWHVTHAWVVVYVGADSKWCKSEPLGGILTPKVCPLRSTASSSLATRFRSLDVSTITTTPLPMESSWPAYRLSVDQYEAMVESGIFTERDKLQLIDGMLVAKVTQGDDHIVADDLCRDALNAVVPAGWFVRSAKPVRLPPNNEPEPDEAIIRGKTRDYKRGTRGKPGPQDVGLIAEVSDSSLADDRAMVRVYGPSGIPVYWIVNLVDRQVEVYSDPRPEGYETCEVYHSGQQVPVVLDRVVVGHIAVDDILP